jgi:ClpP class serine protease
MGAIMGFGDFFWLIFLLPAASILTVLERKDVNKIDDETLVLADMSRKAMTQIRETVRALLIGNGREAVAADELAHTVSEGRWTHDYPITADMAKDYDLPVSTDLRDGVRDVIRLYPQPRGRTTLGGVHPAAQPPASRRRRPSVVRTFHLSGVTRPHPGAANHRGRNRTEFGVGV